MKPKYTKRQIEESIKYWQKQLQKGNYKKINEAKIPSLQNLAIEFIDDAFWDNGRPNSDYGDVSYYIIPKKLLPQAASAINAAGPMLKDGNGLYMLEDPEWAANFWNDDPNQQDVIVLLKDPSNVVVSYATYDTIVECVFTESDVGYTKSQVKALSPSKLLNEYEEFIGNNVIRIPGVRTYPV